MELFLAQLLGLYLMVMGFVVTVTKASIMPAIKDLTGSKPLLFVLAAIELAAGLAIVLVYPKIDASIGGIISLIGWMMAVEAVVYLVLPTKEVQKFVRYFNKPQFYVWGGIACVALGAYLAGHGFQLLN